MLPVPLRLTHLAILFLMWELCPPSFCTSIHRPISNRRTFPLLAHTNHRTVTPIKQPVPPPNDSLSPVSGDLRPNSICKHSVECTYMHKNKLLPLLWEVGVWRRKEGGGGGCKYHPLSLAEHEEEMELSAGLRPVSSTVRWASTLTPSKRSRGIIFFQDGDEREAIGWREIRAREEQECKREEESERVFM